MDIRFRMLVVVSMMLAVLGLPADTPTFAQASVSRLLVYPSPDLTPSPQFTVTVAQGGPPLASFVYQTQNPGFATPPQPSSSTLEQNTSWTSFSTNAPVTVQVTNNVPFKGARILPSRYEIYPTVSGNTVTFQMTPAQRQLSVEFCYSASPCNGGNQTDKDIANPLLIFANPFPFESVEGPLRGRPAGQVVIARPGTRPPALGVGQSFVYFGPGVHSLDSPYQLATGQSAYLEGGAYVKGMFAIASGATDVTIEGDGILSGENVSRLATCPDIHSQCPMMIDGSAVTGGIAIRGITVVNAPYYNIQLDGTNNHVDNIKVMSWLSNTDGITVAGNYASSLPNALGSSLRNSFFKTGDDAIKLYSSNLEVTGCTLWQLNNAAPFEMGVNLKFDVSNVAVHNANVIRAEWTWANRSNAVFSAAFGGNAKGSAYLFNDIVIDDPILQLFKLAVIPNPYTSDGNNLLNTISGVKFSNVMAIGGPTLPNLFQSFNPKYSVSGITFDNVSMYGYPIGSPQPTTNANRNFSLGGTVFSSLLVRSTATPATFQFGLFSAAPPPVPQPDYQGPITNNALPPGATIQAVGDFDGVGYASMVVLDATNSNLGVWDPKMGVDYKVIQSSFDSSNAVAGIGDFNGDGYSDILIWNATAQTGTVLLMQGPAVYGNAIPVQPAFPPPSTSVWSVAGVGDINQDGYSDIVLRDQDGNVGIVPFGANGQRGSPPIIEAKSFLYSSTDNYNSQYTPVTGSFDSSWTVVGVGDFWGNGYAGILWTNASGLLGITAFQFYDPKVMSGAVFAQLGGQQIAALADYNGDGATDMLLGTKSNGQWGSNFTIWYSNYNNGALYKTGPSLTLPSQYALQP